MVTREAGPEYHRRSCACLECKRRRFEQYRRHGMPGKTGHIRGSHGEPNKSATLVQILFCVLLVLSIGALIAAIWAIGQDKMAQSAQWWYLAR